MASANDLHRIVVGIDFGTTFTAVAWAETSRPGQIELITNWPTAGSLVGAQVPSEVSYPNDGDTTNFSWGYNISPKAKKVKWFKLALETDSDIFSLPPNVTPVTVVENFLSAIYKHTISTLYRRFDRGVMAITTVDFVLTVPAIWSDAAKQKTYDAARRAGMGNEHALELLSEPESAAIYTLKNMDSGNSAVNVNDRIVVCDCGGGTVDVISYEVRQIQPQLRVAECTAGTGDYCGSTFIDQEFEKLFAKRMGPVEFGKITMTNRQQIVKNFELCKIAFRNDPNLPTFYVNVPAVSDLQSAGIFGGMFEITREEMQALFEPVIVQVLKLVKDQVQAVSEGTFRANSILLVGGFGESEYLYQRVQEWARTYKIQVIQPRDASTAIVRGAVIKGMEPKTAGPAKTEVLRRARRSYGVPTNQVYIPGKHDNNDLYLDPETGEKLARNQMSWFIRKNQVMSDDATFRKATTPYKGKKHN